MKNIKHFPVLLLIVIFSGIVNLNAQVKTVTSDWENPKMFNQNKELPHSTLMPFRSIDEALTQKRNESVFYKSLSGIWKMEKSMH